LLLLGQLAYIPNAVIWGISFMLGPGFAVGAGTVIAPSGSALGSVPSLPMLAALPTGVHAAVPAPLSVAVLVVPYLAGVVGGLIMMAAAPTLELEKAPLWGFGCGTLTGCVLGVMSAFAGGPLGGGRLTAVGPSGWQVALVATLEVGVGAAVAAGVANWLRLRSGADSGAAPPAAASERAAAAARSSEHTIYLDRWAGTEDLDPDTESAMPHGPSSLP
jgi:hypothetical protein